MSAGTSRRGRFITLEGGEGAGKTTQIRLLADRLHQCGLDVVTTREPGGAKGAEDIRHLLVTGDPGRWDALTEALLHFAARRTHLLETVWPALDAGRWVISDRFADSTMAYQGYGHELGRDVIDRLYQIAVGSFRPDLTLILDLPVATGLERAGQRHAAAGNRSGPAEDRYERMEMQFHERLRSAFLEIAKREPVRCRVIDAAAAPEAVARSIWETVTSEYGLSA